MLAGLAVSNASADALNALTELDDGTVAFDPSLLATAGAVLSELLSKDSVEVEISHATLGPNPTRAAYVPFAVSEYIKNSAMVQPLNTLAVVVRPKFEVTSLALDMPVTTFRFDNSKLDFDNLTCVTASCNRTQSPNGMFSLAHVLAGRVSLLAKLLLCHSD